MILNVHKLFFLLLVLVFFIQDFPSFALTQKIDGLDYDVRKIEDPPIEKSITSRFDLYEFFLQNKSEKTFSIPGYSIDLGVDYLGISEINSFYNSKSQKKLAVLNAAAGAASFALGGFARSAANTVRSVSSFKRKNTLSDESAFLSPSKTYVLYSADTLSLLFFVDKGLGQVPNTIRFICRDEEVNVNHVVIDNQFRLRSVSSENNSSANTSNLDVSKEKENEKNNVIAVPATEQYK